MQPFITTGPVKTMIVLGSGGHTAEMLMLLESMDRAFYCPRVYVAANTDHMSAARALSREQEWAGSKGPSVALTVEAIPRGREGSSVALTVEAIPRGREVGVLLSTEQGATAAASVAAACSAWRPLLQDTPADVSVEAIPRGREGSSVALTVEAIPRGREGSSVALTVEAIPRGREVGQSYITSAFTTLYSLLCAARVVLRHKPQLVLVNGPSTCVPVCAMACLYRMLALFDCRVVYVESIARVRKLSLSGKILYYGRMVDRFLVQWPELQVRFPRSIYAGRLY
uniref:UDP-N-acetylglucosamine transferase subunit ALG14 n=1 Tax=Tetradesmus obliquus TaxID=3088 RepID=A0A383VRD0_TETOB|eukprot:jgi/Sobl393_1/15109/SZX67731.1